MPTSTPTSTRTCTAPDGTELGYHESGDGDPVVCLAGGPMQDSAYLGDLGGLAGHRRVIRLDLRGTGSSAVPRDPASYRCDRLVEDLEALRTHLGLDRLDLLAHCAGANLAVRYAARYPGRTGRLALVTPSVRAVGVPVRGEDRLAAARLHRDEPWFPDAYAGLERIVADRGGPADRQVCEPLFHGRWDEAARRHQAAADGQRNDEAAGVFAAEGAFDPDATRAALGRLRTPVLVLAGEADPAAPPPATAAYAGLFAEAAHVVQAGAGHFPWRDDPAAFARTAADFLT